MGDRMSLAGQVAVVTGGGTGLGAAIARRLAQAGAHVVVAGIVPQTVEATAREIGGLAVAVDVTDESSVAALFRTIEVQCGRLDVLVNSAGVGGRVAATADIKVEDWDTTFAVNVRGTLACMKHAIPLLKRQGGAIVNIASRAGLRGIPFQSAYSSSKFAVIGLTMAAALELGPMGVRVNAVCPGAVDTDLYRANAAARAARRGESVEQDKARLAQLAALRRLAEPEDVADTALYLASRASGAITGEAIRVDGGRL